ncbi:unnamed protein product [Euphydryas editha]|uniref:Daxx histone-binding domain-containing protein n=1 Tax=Euphydryas editha TaxID=104508 RepID=A0AAU9U3P4_EUPED|nr:unnamed protein product [Euphydryas editha]
MSSVDIVELSENEDDCVVDSIINENNIDIFYKKICGDKPLLTELIETCFNLENSASMKHVINSTFLKRYMKTDKKFKESQEFEKALRRAINLLKNESGYKFSHIKDLCEILRTRNIKKRVQLTTLSNKSKDNGMSCQRKSKTETNSKIQKMEIIDLDSTENNLIIDLDLSLTGDKENDMCLNKIIHENKLLVPHKSLDVHELNPVNQNTIKKIEEEIVLLKKRIAELDEQEVDDDSMNSPYIQSENYKARIVTLYKELCKLTGVEAVKRSTVHLKVLEGHPSGPVRRLETFLNKNVGSDGHPPFPSFRDVVKCVVKANEEDRLDWSKQQIMNEAVALFTHCGRALQKRRQRREWRDLVSKVKVERDPADDDPALLARLEDNRRRALRQEAEILERYAMLQNAPPQKKSTIPNQATGAHESSTESETDSSSDEECTKDEQNINLPSQIATCSKNNTDINMNEDNSEVTVVKIKKEHQSCIGQILEELGDNYTTSIIDIEDTFVDIEILDSSNEDSD